MPDSNSNVHTNDVHLTLKLALISLSFPPGPSSRIYFPSLQRFKSATLPRDRDIRCFSSISQTLEEWKTGRDEGQFCQNSLRVFQIIIFQLLDYKKPKLGDCSLLTLHHSCQRSTILWQERSTIPIFMRPHFSLQKMQQIHLMPAPLLYSLAPHSGCTGASGLQSVQHRKKKLEACDHCNSKCRNKLAG